MAEQITSDNFERFRVIHLKTQGIKKPLSACRKQLYLVLCSETKKKNYGSTNHE